MEAEKVTQEIREKLAEAFYSSHTSLGDMQFWQAKAVGGTLVQMAYARAHAHIRYLFDRGDIKILDEKGLPKLGEHTGHNICVAEAQLNMRQWHKDSLKDFTV